MSKTLSPKQLQNLEIAIQEARGCGDCSYVLDGEPGCVIGQLASLEGVELDTLLEWDHASSNGKSAGVGKLIDDEIPGSEPLRSYPANLLFNLQRIWDRVTSESSSLRVTEDDLRELMLREVAKERANA